MSIVKIFFDTETTGTDPMKHSIHELGMIIEVDGIVVEEVSFNIRPHALAKIEPEALAVCKKTERELYGYPEMRTVYAKLIELLGKYIDKFDTHNMAWLIGFNNRAYDDRFLRIYFELCSDRFIGSWFWNDTIDTLCLASQYLIERRPNMPSFKLKRVAMELGLVFDDSELHGALNDARLIRKIYRIVTGLDMEL